MHEVVDKTSWNLAKQVFHDALTYKNLLLRLQANLETDADLQQSLIAQADKLREQAIDLQKRTAQ